MATAQEILEESKRNKNTAMQSLNDFKNYYENYKKNTNRVNTNDALNKYNSASNNFDNKVNQGYKPSNNVNDALNQSNQWANAMGNMGDFKYENKYDDKISELLNKFENNKFSYDINSDPLYQQLAENFQQKGKQAMMDTMGQASAMTGGYGSSYASSVGQQAYQQNLNELNSVAPQLAEMAYGHYSDQQNQTLQLSQFYSDLDMGDYNKAIGTYQSNMDRYKGMMDYYQNQYQYMDSAEREEYKIALDGAFKQMNQAYGVYEGAQGQDNYENTMQNDMAKAKADQANKEYDYAREMALQMANQANTDREYNFSREKYDDEKTRYNTEAEAQAGTNELAYQKLQEEIKRLRIENGESGASGDVVASETKASQLLAGSLMTSSEYLKRNQGKSFDDYIEYIMEKADSSSLTDAEKKYVYERCGVNMEAKYD